MKRGFLSLIAFLYMAILVTAQAPAVEWQESSDGTAAEKNDLVQHFSAKLELADPVISASAAANGTIYPNGNTTVPLGNNQTYTITPNANYSIADVLIDGISNAAAISSGTYTFTNVNSGHTISASFIFNNTYTIASSTGSNGSISPAGETAVPFGGNQTYTINPNTGYHILSVMVDGVNNPAAVSSHTYTFTNVTTEHTINATFAINTYSITASAGVNGSISPSGLSQVNYNGYQPYTITPDGGYYVADVLVDGVSAGRLLAYGFYNVSANHTISVNFVPVPPSPAIQWQKSLGGTGYDAATCTQQTTDGGYIAGGTSRSNDGDVTGNHGDYDYWVVKLTANGNISWQKSFGGSKDDQLEVVRQTTDGGYILAGYSNSTDGDVTGHHGTNSFSDWWIVKLNNTGTIEWQKSYGGSASEGLISMEQTIDGGYIAAGNTGSTDGDLAGIGNGGGWILKISNTGAIQWQKSYTANSTSSTIIGCIKQTSDTGYIVGGRTDADTSHFDKILKLDATGNIQWQTITTYSQYRDPLVQYYNPLKSILQTPDGGYAYLTTTDYYYKYRVVKFNSSGTELWHKEYGGRNGNEYASSMKLTADGGFILNGMASSVDGDVWPNTYFTGDQYWVLKLNSTGDMQWQKPLGGTRPDYGYWAEETNDGGYIISGCSQSNNNDVSGNHGDNDMWIVKLVGPGAYAITASSGPNGSISPAGITPVISGRSQAYTINPQAGYDIADVLVDSISNAGAISSGTYTFINVMSAHNIRATFTNHDSVSVFMCPPADSTMITSSVSGSNYRWQVNDSSGFVNITSNSHYSGTATATIKLINIPSSWYGFKYRCIVNGASSLEYILKFKETWVGGVDNNWETAANWSCGQVPDANTDVIIPMGNNIMINTNVTIRSLNLSPGTNVTVAQGFNLTILH